MKILLVSLFLPQEKAYHAGGRYVFDTIKNLSEKHEIHLVTRLEEGELPYLRELRPFCREIHPYTYRTKEERGLMDIFSLILNYVGFSRYADKVAGGGGFDLIQVEWVEAALCMKKKLSPMVLDAHDVITKPAERLMKDRRGILRVLFFFRYLLIKLLELRIMKRFDMVFTLSRYDREYLLSMDPRLRVRVVPIPAGLDIGDKPFPRSENTILFLASFKYRRVNVEAALYFYRAVFPLVRKAVPGAKFIIAGYGPPEELRMIAADDPAVTVTGFVENTEDCYKQAAVFVAPILTGGGLIVKVLDAMAASTPVVTTSYGNEGVGAEDGRDLLVADDPESFAGAVVRILRDREFADTLAKKGRDFVAQNYSREAVKSRRDSSYAELMGGRSVRG